MNTVQGREDGHGLSDSSQHPWLERNPCLIPAENIKQSSEAAEKYFLNEEVTVIGRGEDTDLMLSSPGVSRRHAMILRKRDRYFISDLESTNGTCINREKIREPSVLREGDCVSIGSLEFRFSFHDQSLTQLRDDLRGMGVLDESAGVYHKGYFLENLKCEFEYTRRNQGNISLVLFEVDYFGLLKETWGASGVDKVLSGLGRILNRQARIYDIVAKVGEDQFMLLVRGAKIQEVRRLTERIRQSVEEYHFDKDNPSLRVTLSGGISVYDGGDNYDSPGQFIDNVEAKMQMAKKSGRNRICF